MLSSKDHTHTQSFGKEEELQYHLSQMKYHFQCLYKAIDEVGISARHLQRHSDEAKALRKELEATC
jgi:hypothetical protein